MEENIDNKDYSKMSRIDILNDLAIKYSRDTDTPVNSFYEWLEKFDSNDTVTLVTLAMTKYGLTFNNK